MLRSFAYAATAAELAARRRGAGGLGGAGARALPRRLPRDRSTPTLLPAGRGRDRAAARRVRAREGGLRAALRARQPPRLGGIPVAGIERLLRSGRGCDRVPHAEPLSARRETTLARTRCGVEREGGSRHPGDAGRPRRGSNACAATEPVTVELGANPHGARRHEADGGVVVRASGRRRGPSASAGARRSRRSSRIRRGSGRRCSRRRTLPLDYELEVEYPDGNTFTVRDPYAFLPTLGELDLHLAMEGRHEQLYERLGAHVREIDGVAGTAFAVWAPNARAGLGRRRLQLLGRAPAPDALARLVRDLGAVRPRRRRGDEVQVRAPHAGRAAAAEERPGRLPHRGAAGERLGRLGREARVARRGVARAPPRRRAAPRAGLDLRGPPRLVAAQPARRQPTAHVPRARRRARRLRGRPRLHARRAAAGDGAPVLRLVGLPGDRLLRPDLALRHARRLPRPRRPPARARHRRDPRLGAGALPARRLGARPLRRHAPLRARRPAPRRASRLGHARLQPRPHRGAELPARERPLLAARAPRRRAPRRRGRLDALPRLLAREPASGCRTCSAAARTSRRSRSCRS